MAQVAKKIVDEENLSLTFQFSNGQKLEISINDFPAQIMDRLTIHGAAQKIGDSYAGAESVDIAYANAKATFDQLKSGLWASKSSRGGIWIEALARAAGQPIEVVLEKWAAMDDAKQKAIKADARVKLAKSEIEAERAKKLATDETISLDDL